MKRKDEFIIDLEEAIDKIRDTDEHLAFMVANMAAIVQNSDDAVIGVDNDGTILSWNYGAKKMYQYSSEEIIGKSISTFILPDKLDELQDMLKKINEGEVIHNFETVQQKKNGEKIDVSVTMSPIKDSKGAIIGASTIEKDITQRKKAEKDLRESEKRYRELVETANSIILKIDKKGHITFFNEFAEKFFGFKKEEIMGKSVIGTIVPETESSGRDLQETISMIIKNPEAHINNENENITRDMRKVWVAWTNTGIYDDKGEVIGVLSVGIDISRRKKAEDELKEAHDHLEELVEERTAELKRHINQ